jgi:hypothetical protein
MFETIGIAPEIAPSARHFDTCDDGLSLLDETFGMLSDGDVAPAMEQLVLGLHRLRSLPRSEWTLFKANWAHHPVARVILQDPFTAWSYRKPRGYPGDAQLLDYIYGADNIHGDVAAATACGRAIYGYTRNAPAPAAVRDRRNILTAAVDRLAGERSTPVEVLAIAAGHLREAEASVALAEGRVGRWLALDQDLSSVSFVQGSGLPPCIEPIHGSVRGLLGGRYSIGKFDLVYAAGLYDYLAANVAKRLTENAFAMLKPGGLFIYANFAEGIKDDGYMETFMDWHLNFRTQEQMELISENIPESQLCHRRIFHGDNKNIIYGLLRRN